MKHRASNKREEITCKRNVSLGFLVSSGEPTIPTNLFNDFQKLAQRR